MASAKKEALDTISKMPARATWEEILYKLYVRKKIERGIEAVEQGKVVAHEVVKRRFLK